MVSAARAADKWFQVAEIDDAARVLFGGVDIFKLMPRYSDIPMRFKRCDGGSKWNQLASDWFFSGVKNLHLQPRAGVDQQKALRHIRAILGSWEPKHEHKEAGVAYLFDQWFIDGTWERAK